MPPIDISLVSVSLYYLSFKDGDCNMFFLGGGVISSCNFYPTQLFSFLQWWSHPVVFKGKVNLKNKKKITWKKIWIGKIHFTDQVFCLNFIKHKINSQGVDKAEEKKYDNIVGTLFNLGNIALNEYGAMTFKFCHCPDDNRIDLNCWVKS